MVNFIKKTVTERECAERIWWKCKKSEEKSPENPKHPLTNEKYYDTMDLHSVILCPFVPILIYRDIIAQNMAAVKQ